MDADRRAPGSRPDLDQVAQLVGHPEATVAFVLPVDLSTSDQRVVDPADVADFAEERTSVSPDVERSHPVSMLEAEEWAKGDLGVTSAVWGRRVSCG